MSDDTSREHSVDGVVFSSRFVVVVWRVDDGRRMKRPLRVLKKALVCAA